MSAGQPIEIRWARGADAPAIQAIYAPEVLETAISFEVEPPTVAEMERRIAQTTRTHPWLVCAREGRVVGYAYASAHRPRPAYRWSVDVSVYVDRSARGAGVGRALYTPLLKMVSAQGYVTAYAGITLPNAGSVALHESLGFRPLAVYRGVGWKLGAWHDVGWWERPLAERVTVPSEPRLPDPLSDRPEGG
jgi:phosphinothricin acetyltransferase